jgi:DNA invertase Pin-like site-specific DNA recombinase
MDKAIGYIRRSHHDSGGTFSIDEQEQDIAALAARYELTVLEVHRDLGRSGGDYKGDPDSDALKHRPAFRALLRAVESGKVDAVLASRIDRLGRSQNALGRLWAACERTGTKVITTEGNMNDAANPATVLLRGMLGVFAEYYLAEQTRKNRRAMKTMDARGDAFGQAPYGYVKRTPKRDGTERVVMEQDEPEAIERLRRYYREEGKYERVARRLQREGVPVPRPKWATSDDPAWSATTVRRILLRVAPDEVQRVQKRKAYQSTPRLFRRLLRHDCGTVMTPAAGKPTKQGGPTKGYYCNRCKRIGRHPYTVSERKLMPWIMEEAGRLHSSYDVAESDGPEQDDSEDRARLDAARDLIGEDAYREAIARLEAAQDAHSDRQTIRQAIPSSIDWAAWEADPDSQPWSTETVNNALRAMWETVELGADLLPVRAVWTVSDWRAA